jgi:chromosomal replication initiation ATPase DnaA
VRRIRLELGWSYARIGRLFNRDHTTVVHACAVTVDQDEPA